MGSFSIWHWLIVLVIVLLLFGAGKLPSVMGDLAKGMKAFKAGMKDDEPVTPPPAGTTHAQVHTPASSQVPPAAINPAPAQPPVQPASTTAAGQPASATTAGQPASATTTDPTKPHQG